MDDHAEHVTINWAYWEDCLEGECDHVDEDGMPDDLSACPNAPAFEACVDCMDADGRGRDPENWDDVPIRTWPCAAATVPPLVEHGPESEPPIFKHNPDREFRTPEEDS